MKNIILDEIPNLVKENKLSEQEACVQIYITLYTNPGRFNLLDLDKDSRSEFLLDFLQHKTTNLLKNYNPNITSFGAYVFFTIQTFKLSYLNKKADTHRKELLIINEATNNYSNELNNFENFSSTSKESQVAEISEAYIPKSDEEKIPTLVYKKLFTRHKYKLSTLESQNRKLKQGLLIIALKSAWYINDEQINKVSSVCEISADIISDSICRLKANLITKSLCRKKIEENRNRAYLFIDKYKKELEKIKEKDSPIFFKISTKLNYQQKNFINKNNLLQTGKFKIAPSNSEISSIIGIPERQVSCYLSRFKALDFSKFQALKNSV